MTVHMWQDKKVLVVIPARGGSKGVPQKNIRPFAGKPLIAHTIQLARALEGAQFRTIVSTDSEEIADVGRRYGAEVPFLRPKHLAEDKSLVADAVVHLLDWLTKKEKYSPDYVMLLQPTSPLREIEDITRCMDALEQSPEADNVLTVCRTHPLLYHLGPGNRIVLANKARRQKYVEKDRLAGFARQAFPEGYKLNGCFVYLIRRETLLAEKTFYPRRTIAVVVDAWRSVDIDHPEDFVLAETLYRSRHKLRKALASF
jgi:CMP-N,N'-diacetyllegionaminic acid synthase